MHNFRELNIWKKGLDTVKKCYELAAALPGNERYGFISQIQRAAVSIPANIAEGSGKSSNKDFCRFLEISISSAFELETLIILAIDLKLIPEESGNDTIKSLHELQKMIHGFINSLSK